MIGREKQKKKNFFFFYNFHNLSISTQIFIIGLISIPDPFSPPSYLTWITAYILTQNYKFCFIDMCSTYIIKTLLQNQCCMILM